MLAFVCARVEYVLRASVLCKHDRLADFAFRYVSGKYTDLNDLLHVDECRFVVAKIPGTSPALDIQRTRSSLLVRILW